MFIIPLYDLGLVGDLGFGFKGLVLGFGKLSSD